MGCELHSSKALNAELKLRSCSCSDSKRSWNRSYPSLVPTWEPMRTGTRIRRPLKLEERQASISRRKMTRSFMTLDNNPTAAIPPLSSLFQAFPSQPLTLLLGLFATLVAILLTQYIRSPWRKVPPGPKGLPVLGNALQFRNKDWMYEKECKQKFGSSNSIFLPTP